MPRKRWSEEQIGADLPPPRACSPHRPVDSAQIALLDLDTGEQKVLIPGGSYEPRQESRARRRVSCQESGNANAMSRGPPPTVSAMYCFPSTM